jgi:hypothetical protein
MAERETTDADRLEILRAGVHLDGRMIDQLVDTAAALYTPEGLFKPRPETVEALWELIAWHRSIDDELEADTE